MDVLLKQTSGGLWVIVKVGSGPTFVWNRAARAGLGGWVPANKRQGAKFTLEGAQRFCETKGFNILEELQHSKTLVKKE